MKNQQLVDQLELYSSNLKAFAYSFTRDTDAANDLYQDTILKAIRYFDKFTQETNLKAWLFTIMRNTFINDYRKALRKSAVINTKEQLDSSDMYRSATTNGAEGNFVINDVNKMLALLPKVYSVPFVKYFEGYHYHEIADELNIPIGTVKTRIHAARQLLKKHLRPYSNRK